MPKDSPSPATTANPRRKSKRSSKNGIWNHAMLAIVVSLAGVVCAALLLYWQLVLSANEDHQQRQVEVYADMYAAYFNNKIDEMRVLVNAGATAQATVDALISNNPTTMKRRAEELTAGFGYAERVDIIPLGTAQVDLDAGVPISYAMLDLIKRSESQEFAGPEVSKNQENYLYAGQPIIHNGVPEGVLFVVFDKVRFLRDPAARNVNVDVGRGRILQILDDASGDRDKGVFELGKAPTDIGQIIMPLSVGHWQLEFTPDPSNIPPLVTPSNLLAALAVVLGFTLAGVSLAFSTLNRKLQADADQLASYGSSLIRGRGGQLERYKLPLFQQLASTFANLGRGRGGQAAEQAPSRPAVPEVTEGPAEPAPKATRAAAKAPAAADTANDLLDDSSDFLDVRLADNATENFGIEVDEEDSPLEAGVALDPEIFRAYDIRGITTTNLTAEVVYWIGRAFAAEALELEQKRVAVGRDGRESSVALRDELVRGLTEGGIDVLDVGMVPTPLLYFATHAMDTGTGIMITGSHNPPDYNGLKMVMGGVTLAEERIDGIRLRLEENRLSKGDGDVEELDLNDHYLDRVLEDVAVAQPAKVVVDCGNGVAGIIAPRLLEELGCEVVPLYCDVDGTFPNHHPDPAEPANLQDLIDVVRDEKADLGLAFDGDGDRLGVVTATGEIIWPDKLLMLFAQDIVGRNPGADIIYDVKCSRHLNSLISDCGGRPIMWRTGHSHMKAKLKETGALLAGEFSGHVCFGERWYGFDDALYSAARLLEIIGSQNKSVDELFGQYPTTFSTPELKIDTTESAKFQIIDKLANTADFGDGTITDIDGLRVDFADGWGLIRASNTSPVLSLRFEADSEDALKRIMQLFQTQLGAIDSSLKFG